MSTRANVVMPNPSSPKCPIVSIYIHFEGYPEHTGEILKQNYNTTAKLEQLFSLGDLALIGPEIGEKHDFKTHGEGETKNWCLSYFRDYGDSRTKAMRWKSLGDFTAKIYEDNIDYVYLWVGNKFIVWKNTGKEPIIDDFKDL